MLDETRIRLDAIHYVRDLRERWVAVPASEVQHFTTGGQRVFLKGQQGIFKPAELTEPLSITSTIDSPYTDDPIEGSRVLYDFLPSSREFENLGLKRCAEAELPLIYFLAGQAKPDPEYVIFAPVYVVGWDDVARRFLIDLSEQKPGEVVSPPPVTRQLTLPAIRTPQSPMEISRDVEELRRDHGAATAVSGAISKRGAQSVSRAMCCVRTSIATAARCGVRGRRS